MITAILYGALSASAPWTPAQLTNLIYWDGIAGNGGTFKDNPPVTPCANGDPCATLKGLYGSSINAVQTTLLDEPTATNAGLTLDTGGLDSMTPGTPLVLDPTVGFTLIGVLNNPAGSSVPLLGNLTGQSVFGIAGDSPTFADDAEDVLQNPVTNGLMAIWMDCDSSGNATMRVTGDSGPATQTLTSVATFNQFGMATGQSITNDDSGNLYINVWIVPSHIAYGSPTQLSIAAWLTSKYGATLP